MKKFMEEFKAFAMRGNVVDMAVGVVIGGAFGKISTSIVNTSSCPWSPSSPAASTSPPGRSC